jgi:hypothetical protein
MFTQCLGEYGYGYWDFAGCFLAGLPPDADVFTACKQYDLCIAGMVTTGAIYDIAACDLGTTNGATVILGLNESTDAGEMLSPYGAAIASAIAGCVGSYGCNCFAAPPGPNVDN